MMMNIIHISVQLVFPPKSELILRQVLGRVSEAEILLLHSWMAFGTMDAVGVILA